MIDRSTFYHRVAAALLALLGLGPFIALGVSSGDWSVLRLTIVDPLVVIAACALLAWVFPDQVSRLVRGSLDRLERIPRRTLLVSVGLFIVVAACLVSLVAFNMQPAYSDEYTQAFQAQMLRHGRLSAVPERYPEFFETAQTVRRFGKWFGQYPVLSAVLVLPIESWLVNPILLAVTGIAIYSFARRAFDEATARIALILLALSPFAVFMAATRMSHVPTLALTAIALACLCHPSRSEGDAPRHGETGHPERSEGDAPRHGEPLRFASLSVTGASLGLMAMLRPYDAVLVAIPIGVFQLVMLKRDRSLLRPIAIQVAVALAFASIQLLVNARTTGSPFLFAYDALNGAAHRPGFHTDPLGFPFTPAKGLDLVIRYLSRLNTGLFESVVPATLFIAGAMWLARPTKWDWLLTGLMFSVLVGYGSYWVDGTFLGPRFLYTALPAFVILSARFVALSSRAERGTRFWPGAALLLPACIALALVPSSIGHRSTGIWLRLDGLRRGPVAMTQNPLQDVGSASISNALVFVREPLHSRITARLRALGMAPFDAERTVSDMDACTLLAALARSDARPDLPIAQRRVTVFEEARKAGQGRSVPGLVGASALSITGGPQFTQECRDEIDGDRAGVEAFERFLAVSTFDDDGRLGGDIVFARYLGARDSILAADPRFSGRAWFLYHRNPGSRVGSFELIRRPGG